MTTQGAICYAENEDMYWEYCHGYRFANPLDDWIVITPHDSQHSEDILKLAQDQYSNITGIIFLDNKEI